MKPVVMINDWEFQPFVYVKKEEIKEEDFKPDKNAIYIKESKDEEEDDNRVNEVQMESDESLEDNSDSKDDDFKDEEPVRRRRVRPSKPTLTSQKSVSKTKPKTEGQANKKMKKPRHIIPLTSSDDDSEDEKNAFKKPLAVTEKYVLTLMQKRRDWRKRRHWKPWLMRSASQRRTIT